MGWDFIQYNDEHEQFRDSDLWLLRDFFIRGTESLATALPPTSLNELRAFFERWDWCGPGVFIGTDFTEFISGDHSRWEFLFRAMQCAGDIISEFGDRVPLSYIHPIGVARGCYYTQDLPTRLLLESIGRICTMLAKHEPPKATPNDRHA